MKETVKKLVCMIAVITIVFAVPGVAKAADSYLPDSDYKIVIDYQSPIAVRYFNWNWVSHDTKYVSMGDRLDFGANFILGVRIEIQMNLYPYIQKYLPIIENATNAWLMVSFDLGVDSGFTVSDSVSTRNMYYYINGTQYDGFSSSYNGSFDGVIYYSPFDFGTAFSDDKPIESFSTLLGFYANTGEGASYYDTSVIVRSYSATIYLQGVDGANADQFIVITNDLKNVDASVQQVKNEVKVMQGQLDNIQSDINSGFDEVGGKLDNIQSDINTGLDNVTGAINGSGADTSGMDNGMAQLGGQLGDLGDVEDELGGLIMDKVEVPDLILTNDQSSALSLLVSCLNLAYVDLRDYQVMFASVLFFGIIGVLLFGRRNL